MHKMLETDLPLIQVISCKTRELRPGEKDGIDYHYITQEQFVEMRDAGDFLEYAQLHQMFWYGTRKKEIVEALIKGENIIKEMDVQGLQMIQESHPDVWEVTRSIFIDIPDDVIRERVSSRAPLSEEEMQHRLESAVMERELAKQYCTDIIDGSGSREEVAAYVYNLISEYISGT